MVTGRFHVKQLINIIIIIIIIIIITYLTKVNPSAEAVAIIFAKFFITHYNFTLSPEGSKIHMGKTPSK